MLSKFVAAACLAAHVAADSVKVVAALNKAWAGNFYSAGEIGEWKGESEEADGEMYETIYFWI